MCIESHLHLVFQVNEGMEMAMSYQVFDSSVKLRVARYGSKATFKSGEGLTLCEMRPKIVARVFTGSRGVYGTSYGAAFMVNVDSREEKLGM